MLDSSALRTNYCRASFRRSRQQSLSTRMENIVKSMWTRVHPVVCVCTLFSALPAPVAGWWVDGHAIQAKASVLSLPDSVPAFFLESGGIIAYFAADPDLAKSRSLPLLRDAERPEHYLDIEFLKGRTLPDTRSGFLKLCAELDLEPSKVGSVVYAIAEWTQRLTLAFAEHRKWPEVEALKLKCLLYAGLLAHYSQDLCQPLHTTVHFDGRSQDGRSPHSGIHEHVDSIVGRLELQPQEMAVEGVEPLVPLMAGILKELHSSHHLVDRVYELEAAFGSTISDQVRSFAMERSRASARFTASLFLTAWKESENTQLPDWLTLE